MMCAISLNSPSHFTKKILKNNSPQVAPFCVFTLPEHMWCDVGEYIHLSELTIRADDVG